MASVAVLDRIAAVRPVPDATPWPPSSAPAPFFFDSDDKEGACSGIAEDDDTLSVTLLDEQQAIPSTMVGGVDAFTHAWNSGSRDGWSSSASWKLSRVVTPRRFKEIKIAREGNPICILLKNQPAPFLFAA